MSILVTGGTGYIGAHTTVELISSGHDVIVYDNFNNSDPEVINRIEMITGKRPRLIEGDIRDASCLSQTFEQYKIDVVIHFAALKAVRESSQKPLDYYDNNVMGLLTLCRVMSGVGVKKLVFSSSATVYGEPQFLPLSEDHPLSAVNPYGRTKLICEDILRDLFRAESEWSISLLRYFNPIGAHETGLIGEDPKDIPNNLMPYITQVAIGRRERLMIWGNDYKTIDGTGVRDYIHVVDLAKGHVKAMERLTEPQCVAINLGTGRGYSVLEMLSAFEKVSGRKIAFEYGPRRTGDVATCYADTTLAHSLLEWQPERGLEAMCSDAWRWQSGNPWGYMRV